MSLQVTVNDETMSLQEAIKREQQKREKRKQARRQRNELMRSLGLTKVRGSVSGRTYWE